MIMIQRIKHYLFYPRFHFNRFQLNLVAIFFLTVGFIAGSYFALSKIFPHAFALNDTHKTWNLNASTTGDYTKSLVTIEGTEESPIGAHPTGGLVGANELANPGFATGSEGGDA
ncbi:MAG TPA: hypothetical protein PLF86_03380, partial [Candidatus Moranbacteria bacterium]|nr:hypothetical protein [Candidatus Moranbacteria bacterium]